MHCVKCGIPLGDDVDFCPECGTPVDRAGRRDETLTMQAGGRSDVLDASAARGGARGGSDERKRLLVLIALLLALIAAMLVTIALLLTRKDDATEKASPAASLPTASSTAVPLEDEGKAAEQGSAGAQAPASSAQAPTTATSQPVTYSSPCITITMPAKYVDMGASWITTDHYMALELFDTQTGSRIQVASIPWDERAAVPYEVKEERWSLGPVTDDGVVSEAVLHVSYVDDEGKVIYGGLDTPSDTLACSYYLGCSAEEILSWIETNGDLVGTVSTPQAADGLSGRTAPFWGVWAYASKDLGEALDFANGAASEGFAAEVFLTTDWANLNDEPWYVVSLGCVSTEGEADAVLARAHEGWYPDAYEKHSGDYVG